MVISNGNVANADEVNAITNLQQVYTGTGFNSTASNSTDEQEHELDAISSTGLSETNYAVIRITGTTATSQDGETQLKAQIKETGQSYADIIAYKTHFDSGGTGNPHSITNTYEIISTLTAGMKTNGFQVKVFSKSIGTGAAPAGAASFTNINTTVEARK
jgi:hypothetical protein